MYKTEFIRQVAHATRLSQPVVAAVTDAAQRLITHTLQGGQRVTFPGFGTFYTRKRQAGRIQHIRTHQLITVPARALAAFRVGELLKRAVAGKRRGRARRG